MAAISKSGTPSLATPVPPTNCNISGLLAGEAIAAGDACYIKSDGKIWKSTSADPDVAAAFIDGFAATSALTGEPVTLFFDVHFHYGSGMTPGSFAYLSTGGALVDAAAYANQPPCAKAIDATRLRVYQLQQHYIGVEAA